jgi:hypothetical protein
MNFIYTYTSNVIDFPSGDYGYKEIEDFLFILNKIMLDEKGVDFYLGWTICFYLFFRNSDVIGVYKKGRTYVKDKEKEFTIIIPVPDDKEVSWGVRRSKFGYSNPIDESKFLTLTKDYYSFSNEKDYIIDCTKRAIIAFLKYGMTIEGKKVRFEDIDKKIGYVSD